MRITTSNHRLLPVLASSVVAAVAALALLATAAEGAMRSQVIAPGLCETTGGGRFVDIPGFPGEQIDRRLLRDVKLLQRRFNIYITDGYSLDPVHSSNGEHPVGLALDIIPNFDGGGTWRDINKLARWAEPEQNAPVAPFRWVGYNGDANHGKGHHLHLSWNHSPAKYGKPARTVYTVLCPKPADGNIAPPPPPPDNGGGGTLPDSDPDDTGDGGIPSRPRRVALGSVESRLAAGQADAIAETGGVDTP